MKEKIIFRFFVENYNETIKEDISSDIVSFFSENFNEKITLKNCLVEQYWKIPEYTEVIFKVSLNINVEIKFIFENLSLNALFKSNDIIWDKKTHRGVFLNNNIIWAQVYKLNGDE
jgi:hypothetical protein